MAIGQQGKAFVTVEADLRPFAKDLGREIPRLLKEAEAATKAAAGKTMGAAGREGGRHFSDQFRKRTQGPGGAFAGVASALAGALDDGISALPAEVKAAIVVGLIASLPVIGALLTGAISLALIAGFSGLGVLIAAQYEVVREEGIATMDELRRILVTAGAVFVQPVLDALDLIRDRVLPLQGTFESLFTTVAKFIVPLTDALLTFVEAALPGLQDTADNLVDLLPTLVEGAQFLGESFGEALFIITDSDGAQASLETLIGLVGALVLSAAIAIRIFTDLYALLLQTSPLILILGDTTEATVALRNETSALTTAQSLAIAATDRQEQAMRKQEAATKAAQKAVDDFINAQFDFAHAEIDFERALDNLTEAVKENGRSLDITTEKGRRVSEAILRGLETARREREEAIASGKLTEAQAEANYQKEIGRLRDRAIKAGITAKAYDDLAASVLGIPATPIDMKLSKAAQEVLRRIQEAVAAVALLARFRPPVSRHNRPPGVPELAVGGIVNSPTLALVGEAGPEAVIPLNRPQRAAEVMAEAGVGGLGDVYVYVGDEQLKRRMYRVARGAQRDQASRLYAGTRKAF